MVFRRFLFFCAALLLLPVVTPSNLVLSGVLDSPSDSRAVELHVLEDIADLSDYGLGVADNHGGTDGQEFTFPAVTATKGTYLYVSRDSTSFNDWFGFFPDHTSSKITLTGDDAVELYFEDAVVDVFGTLSPSGASTPASEGWAYEDGWAYRVSGTGPDSSFVSRHWIFSGVDALDGETTNSAASQPFPLQSYGSPAPVDDAHGVASDLRVDVAGQWRFENDYLDSTENGHTSTPVGSPSFDTGKINQGLSLGGYLTTAASDTILPGNASWSLGAWVKTPALTSSRKVITIKAAGGLTKAGIALQSDSLPNVMCLWTQEGIGGQKWIIGSGAWADGQWHHMLCTYDSTSSEVRLYFDGSPVASALTTANMVSSSSDPAELGEDVTGHTLLLDEATIWSKALTADEASKLSSGHAYLSATVGCSPGTVVAGTQISCTATLVDDFGGTITDANGCKLKLCPLTDGNGDTIEDWTPPTYDAGEGEYTFAFTPTKSGSGHVGLNWDTTYVTSYSFNVTAAVADTSMNSVNCAMESGSVSCTTQVKDQYSNLVRECVQDFTNGGTVCTEP